MDEQPAHRGITPSSLNSIPLFRTNDNARHWLERIERHARVFRWGEHDKLDVARCRLGAEAQVWESGTARGIDTWKDFCDAFLERYDVREEELYNQLTNCRQAPNETVRQYADRYRHLASQLKITIDRDPTHLYNFLRGLHKPIHQEVYRMRPRTLAQAIEDAIYISEGYGQEGQVDTATRPAAVLQPQGRPVTARPRPQVKLEHGGRWEPAYFVALMEPDPDSMKLEMLKRQAAAMERATIHRLIQRLGPEAMPLYYMMMPRCQEPRQADLSGGTEHDHYAEEVDEIRRRLTGMERIHRYMAGVDANAYRRPTGMGLCKAQETAHESLASADEATGAISPEGCSGEPDAEGEELSSAERERYKDPCEGQAGQQEQAGGRDCEEQEDEAAPGRCPGSGSAVYDSQDGPGDSTPPAPAQAEAIPATGEAAAQLKPIGMGMAKTDAEMDGGLRMEGRTAGSAPVVGTQAGESVHSPWPPAPNSPRSGGNDEQQGNLEAYRTAASIGTGGQKADAVASSVPVLFGEKF